ncbi:MAG: c-type cytochrome biogenesis protein CcmI [Pseudomonadota bacterium]
MITFWGVAITLTAVVVLVLARTAMTARGAEPAAQKDVEIYKSQLREVERDVERGVIAPSEAETLRAEIARRLLAADAAAQKAEDTARRAPRAMTWVAALTVAGASLGLYAWLGAPGYGDMPLAARFASMEERAETRPAQDVAQRAYLATIAAPQTTDRHNELVEQLRAAVAERPNDLRGLALLARNEAFLNNYDAAIEAQTRLIALKAEDATAADHRDLAELLIVAAGGYVSPEAEAVLRQALARDRTDAPARYYLGLMHQQSGRMDRAFALWQPLLEESPPDAPWATLIREQLPFVAERAGIRYVMPEGRGPSAADIAAAEEMSPEDRAEMIAGMVDGLADRLATQGGPPEDWARLITAQAVLGNTDTAIAILTEARTVFADRADAMRLFQQAALRAGLE